MSSYQAGDPGELPGLKPDELELLKKIFSSPQDIPQEWKSWLVSYLEANPPLLPISQIFGFSAFTATYAEQNSSGSITVANTWQTLATTGPTVTEIPKGKYVVMYGCNYDASGGATGQMGLCINGETTPSHDVNVSPVQIERFLLMRANIIDLDQDVNSITFKYQSTQVGPSYANRWVLLLKYANL